MEVFSGSALDDGKTGEDSMATESEATSAKEEESEKQVVSSRPVKRAVRAPAKRKTVKKAEKAEKAEKAGEDGDEKPVKKAPRKKRVKVSEKRVVSSRPRKRTSKKKAKEEDESKAEAPETAVSETPSETTQAPAKEETPSPAAAEESDSSPRWGRSQRRQQSPRILTSETAADHVIESTSKDPSLPPAADHVIESTSKDPSLPPAAGEQEAPDPAEPQPAAPVEAQATPAAEEGTQAGSESRRGRGRGRPRRRRPGTRPSPRQEASPPPPTPVAAAQTVTEILAENWSEDRARKVLSEGFLVSLAVPLTTDEEIPTLDAAALADRLRVVRLVLADECMVEDDVTDVMLLDMVMNALGDRIEAYRLTAEGKGAEDLERILDLRYKADRRLIETVNALKNA